MQQAPEMIRGLFFNIAGFYLQACLHLTFPFQRIVGRLHYTG